MSEIEGNKKPYQPTEEEMKQGQELSGTQPPKELEENELHKKFQIDMLDLETREIVEQFNDQFYSVFEDLFNFTYSYTHKTSEEFERGLQHHKAALADLPQISKRSIYTSAMHVKFDLLEQLNRSIDFVLGHGNFDIEERECRGRVLDLKHELSWIRSGMVSDDHSSLRQFADSNPPSKK